MKITTTLKSDCQYIMEITQKIPGLSDKQKFSSEIKRINALCVQKAQPCMIYESFSIRKMFGQTVILENNVSLSGTAPSQLLRGSSQTICFCLTLGSKIDQELNALKKEQQLQQAYLLTSIASAYLYKLNDQLKEKIKKQLGKQDYDLTCSYCPGHNGWQLSEQAKLFNLLQAQKYGFNLQKNDIITPSISVCGIYGYGPQEKICQLPSGCLLCGETSCPFRLETR